ncbi:hypothetical protein FKR81_32475 [Lentzea tibetensis]|uniref:Uncharacterized protein n=1 Tax=Lentzea tibetensis TaxID=2591470 RepID=A0A563EL17_9PSEU|nr:hypothetical protein [Lentzea tibetensis]TWP47430.1 hypothetical protein FKR81_32475 [Lentzea tibetensis]
MLSIVAGVCAIVMAVLIGLCPLLMIVLRGIDGAKDRQLVIHALCELVVGALTAVVQLPGKLAQSFLDVVLSARGAGNPAPPPVEPSPAPPVISPAPALGNEQTPPAEPRP